MLVKKTSERPEPNRVGMRKTLLARSMLAVLMVTSGAGSSAYALCDGTYGQTYFHGGRFILDTPISILGRPADALYLGQSGSDYGAYFTASSDPHHAVCTSKPLYYKDVYKKRQPVGVATRNVLLCGKKRVTVRTLIASGKPESDTHEADCQRISGTVQWGRSKKSKVAFAGSLSRCGDGITDGLTEACDPPNGATCFDGCSDQLPLRAMAFNDERSATAPVTLKGTIGANFVGSVVATFDDATRATVVFRENGFIYVSAKGQQVRIAGDDADVFAINNVPSSAGGAFTDLANDIASGQPPGAWRASSQALVAFVGIVTSSQMRANLDVIRDAVLASNAATTRTHVPPTARGLPALFESTPSQRLEFCKVIAAGVSGLSVLGGISGCTAFCAEFAFVLPVSIACEVLCLNTALGKSFKVSTETCCGVLDCQPPPTTTTLPPEGKTRCFRCLDPFENVLGCFRSSYIARQEDCHALCAGVIGTTLGICPAPGGGSCVLCDTVGTDNANCVDNNVQAGFYCETR